MKFIDRETLKYFSTCHFARRRQFNFAHAQIMKSVLFGSLLVMAVCPLCVTPPFGTVAKFLRHLRLTHADAENFSVQCTQQGCCRTFRSFLVYRKHIYRYHSVTEELHQQELPVLDEAEGVMSEQSASLDVLDSTEHSDSDDVSLADSGECCVVRDGML